MSLALHNVIEKYNVLQEPTKQISDYFRNHPDLYKIALLANHVFRAVSMATFRLALPFSAPMSLGICFAGSLFYRLTVETRCAYKFALPAFAGSIAFPIGLKALADLASGVAFISLNVLGNTLVALLPLTAYVTYIALTVSYDVDHR